MRHPKLSIILLSLFAGGSVPAETPAILTWQDCVRLAALRNPDLSSARKAAEASRALYYGSYNGILPRVNLTSSLSDGSNVPASSRWSAGGTASLDLFNLNDYASIRSASASLDLARANYNQASSEVLSDLYRAFAGLLFAQEQIGVARHIQDIWKHNADLISLRYNSGRESKGNRMRTEAELIQADADINQSERDLRVAQQFLNQVLGGSDFTAWKATGTLVAVPVPEHASDIEPLVLRNPRVIAQLAAVAQARASLASAQSSMFPTLSASYSRSFQGPTYFPSNPSWSAQGVLSYPLFADGPTATYFAVSAARRSIEKAEADLLSLRHQIRTDIESAWAAFAQAQDQVHVQRSFLEAAQQRRKESDIRYESGLLSFDNWELIIIDLVNFERSALRARRDAMLAEGQWRLALGEPLGENNP